jgi:hypothetical protein
MRSTWNTKTIAAATLMLAFGVAAVYAQEMPVNMTLSGTAAPSTVNLQTGTGTSEYRLAGNGTLGPFTLRAISSSASTPQWGVSGCSYAYFPVLAGEGVIRLQDGSLLTLKLTGGGDCIDFAAGVAECTRIFQVLGGTGRLEGASGGTVTLTEAVVPVVPGRLGFFAVTGGIAGTVSGIGEAQNQGGGQ